MNGNQLLCNQNQMSKNLPLKKRRAYLIEPSLINDENQTKIRKSSYSQDDSRFFYVPTPPSSPQVQSYAYFSSNSTHIPQQNYSYHMTQQYFDQYRSVMDHQQQQQQYYGYPVVEDKSKRNDFHVDKHFRRSLRRSNSTFAGRCFTPDDSSSNSSAMERSSADSIEEHFARSLAKFHPSNDNETYSTYHQITESVVDDHFARALGSNTWGKLKDKY